MKQKNKSNAFHCISLLLPSEDQERGKLTPSSMKNLVGLPSDQGTYEQAEEMHRHVLGLRETVLEKSIPLH